MWLASDADTRIYLLGTMHALPRGTDWDAARVGEAVSAADELVLELSPQELARAGDVFRTLAPRHAPLAVDKRLPQAALAGYRSLKLEDGDALDDWAILVLMGQRAAERAKLSSADGVEAGLTTAFRKAGKPIGGLETAEAQLMLFETLDPKTQRAMLTRAAVRADGAAETIGALTAAWMRGDVAALERLINEDIDAVPAARRAIVTDRNGDWARWAKRRMERPGTVLMAVGAGHLVGADGVPTLLAAEGYEVRRVQ
jgi:uncharacterized protein YbaP (TraB family)